MEWIDSEYDLEIDPGVLRIAMDYGAPIAYVAFELSRHCADAPHLTVLTYAQQLQAEGLIPPKVNLSLFFAIARLRNIPLEEAVLQLVVRGARSLKRDQTSGELAK